MGSAFLMPFTANSSLTARAATPRFARPAGRLLGRGGNGLTRSIAIVLYPGVEELDWAGPWEVFTFLSSLEPDSCTVFTVSEHGGELTCAKKLRVIVDHSFETAPDADIILVPGGMGSRTEVDNPRMIEYIQRASAAAELTTSVCTGAFLLERAGILKGKRATTHWASLDRLRALGTVDVLEERWVDEGPVVTSSGVSAGIDMSLYLIGRLWGPETARRVQKGIEYFPAPPYTDVPLPAAIR
jgi:transcriptional regulator GlxA family with amidase domain